jgi:hypothetical protein
MNKKIPCENCGKYVIEIDEIGGTMIVKRGFTGKKGAQYQQGRIIYLTKNCPECGAYHGEKKFDAEKARKRFQELGIDKIVTERKHD